MDHADHRPTNDAKMFRFSPAELERRWALVQAWLVEQGAQALLVQGYEDKVGGNVKWLTDVPSGYPRTVILPAQGLMHLIDSGAHGQTRILDDRDPDQPGVGSIVTTWAFQTAHYHLSPQRRRRTGRNPPPRLDSPRHRQCEHDAARLRQRAAGRPARCRRDDRWRPSSSTAARPAKAPRRSSRSATAPPRRTQSSVNC